MMPRHSVKAFTLLSLASPLAALPLSLNNFRRSITNDTASIASQSFDFIVAGGGLTGLTTAGLLSEDPNLKVLVIEAGYDHHDDPRVYDIRTYGQAFETELDYELKSTPIQYRGNETLHLVAGKMLGGSSSLNGASWTKGPKSQYDLLPMLTGDETWSFDGFNSYMLRAEHFHNPDAEAVEKGAEFTDEYHGRQGTVDVSFAQGIFGFLQREALAASENFWPGLRLNADAASGIVNGATTIPNMVQPDVSQNRSNSWTAYIQKNNAINRPNLTILTGHRVTSITWDYTGNTITANGVTFTAASGSSETHTVNALREVLLAAGSLQSPQLLELSGVGDPAVLEPLGIPIVKSMPQVGRNFQEQTKSTVTFDPVTQDFNGSGPSTAIAFPNVHQVLGPSLAADLYNQTLTSLPAHAAAETMLTAQLNNLFLDNEAAVEFFFTLTDKPLDGSAPNVGLDLWNLIVMSRGSVHINSTDPFAPPVIDPAYFQHPLDLALQTHANMQARQVYASEPLAGLVTGERVPGLDVVPADASYETWEEWTKKTFTSVWHPISTLSMMKEEFGGVVDSRFRVYGIERLRVVDASVLPVQLSAHLSSSLFGFGVRAVDNIREDWA